MQNSLPKSEWFTETALAALDAFSKTLICLMQILFF